MGKKIKKQNQDHCVAWVKLTGSHDVKITHMQWSGSASPGATTTHLSKSPADALDHSCLYMVVTRSRADITHYKQWNTGADRGCKQIIAREENSSFTEALKTKPGTKPGGVKYTKYLRKQDMR